MASGGVRMILSPAQGVAEAINFEEVAPGKVATTGDFVVMAEEVNPVISALEEDHIAVTALHSQYADGATSPFLHAPHLSPKQSKRL